MKISFKFSERDSKTNINLMASSNEITFYAYIVDGKVEFYKTFDLNGGHHVVNCKELEPMDLLCVKGLQDGLEQLYKETDDDRLKQAIKDYTGDSIVN
ncbi:MAG: hypothetical protein ACRCTZ_13670 [Sarcina sp.]